MGGSAAVQRESSSDRQLFSAKTSSAAGATEVTSLTGSSHKQFFQVPKHVSGGSTLKKAKKKKTVNKYRGDAIFTSSANIRD